MPSAICEKSGWEPKKPAVPSQKFFLLGRLEWVASSVMGKFVFDLALLHHLAIFCDAPVFFISQLATVEGGCLTSAERQPQKYSTWLLPERKQFYISKLHSAEFIF
jgi:hypothetical protein